MAKKLNILIVPDEGGNPKRFLLHVFLIKAVVVFAIIILAGFATMAISWSKLTVKALEYQDIALENERLMLENRRVAKLAKELDQNREILARIIRSLGSNVDLSEFKQNSEDFKLDPANPIPQESTLTNVPLKTNVQSEGLFFHNIPSKIPVDGFLSRGYIEDKLFPERSHRGIDIAAKLGAPVVAAGAGRVLFSGWTYEYGNFLLIAHPGGFVTFYGHNLYNLKIAQDEVVRGEPIAMLGTSGKSSAPHLHFEVWRDGFSLDPTEILEYSFTRRPQN